MNDFYINEIVRCSLSEAVEAASVDAWFDHLSVLAVGREGLQDMQYDFEGADPDGMLRIRVRGDATQIIEDLEEGEECPLCRTGTVEIEAGEVRCAGLCGFTY